jgi:hypothetical protein
MQVSDMVFSKTWVKNQSWFQAGKTVSGATNSHRDITNRNQPLLFFPYGSNKQICMDKEEFHWVFGVLRGWFSAKLWSKISVGFKLAIQFLGPPTATGT